MKRGKALLSEEELLVRDKVRKASKRASETREQTLHRQEQSGTHMISINTYHLACAKGSALQCCSLLVQDYKFVSVKNEYHNITLSGTIEVLVLASGLTPFCDLIGWSTVLELAQGFGLVTPDPFSSCELGRVWARDYSKTGQAH